MPHRLLFLWPCLLLIGCNEQESSDTRHDGQASATKSTRHHHRVTTDTADSLQHQPISLDDVDALAPAERDKALAAIAWDAIELDQDLAHRAFGKMSPNSPERIRLIRHYAMRVAEQNLDQAIEWSKALESDTEFSAALSQIAVTLAEMDPRGAANLLTESAAPGRDFDVALVQVIQRWAAQSASDAAEWVVLFPAGAAREAGIRIIAERWLFKDAPTAFAWLDRMSDTELRTQTARAMEGVILQQSPETRDAWLQHANHKIRTELEQQREQALKDVGNNIEQPNN